jgi:hypothetical protein
VTTTTLERPKANWLTVILWLTASLIGYGLVGAMFHFPSGFPPNTGEFNLGAFFGGAMQGLLSGLVVGFLQWLVLRRQVARAGQWVLWTAVGLGVVHAFGDALPDPIALPIIGLVGGLALGAAQWRVLRHIFDKAWLWPVTTAVSWAISINIGLTIIGAIGLRGRPWTPELGATEHGLVGLVAGLGVGLATGVLLGRIQQLPNSKA